MATVILWISKDRKHMKKVKTGLQANSGCKRYLYMGQVMVRLTDDCFVIKPKQVDYDKRARTMWWTDLEEIKLRNLKLSSNTFQPISNCAKSIRISGDSTYLPQAFHGHRKDIPLWSHFFWSKFHVAYTPENWRAYLRPNTEKSLWKPLSKVSASLPVLQCNWICCGADAAEAVPNCLRGSCEWQPGLQTDQSWFSRIVSR